MSLFTPTRQHEPVAQNVGHLRVAAVVFREERDDAGGIAFGKHVPEDM